MADSGVPVLIVEDERIVARDPQRASVGFRYDAFAIAASCGEAMARAAEKCPAVVLMDIRIKGELDGIATARRLRDRSLGFELVFTLAEQLEVDVQDRDRRRDPLAQLVRGEIQQLVRGEK